MPAGAPAVALPEMLVRPTTLYTGERVQDGYAIVVVMSRSTVSAEKNVGKGGADSQFSDSVLALAGL